MAIESKSTDNTQNRITTVEDAIRWCSEQAADVEFSDNTGVSRVWVKVAGHPEVVRETLIDAVNVLDELVRKRRLEECSYIW